MSTRIVVRNFAPTDREYEGLAAVYRAQVTEEPLSNYEFRTGAEFRASDEFFNAIGCAFRRYVAEEVGAGRIVGYVQFYHAPGDREPRHFHGVIRVHPDYRELGIGQRLYAQMMADLNWLDAVTLRAEVFDGDAFGRGDIEPRPQRGLFQSQRWRLAPPRFTPRPFLQLRHAVSLKTRRVSRWQ